MTNKQDETKQKPNRETERQTSLCSSSDREAAALVSMKPSSDPSSEWNGEEGWKGSWFSTWWRKKKEKNYSEMELVMTMSWIICSFWLSFSILESQSRGRFSGKFYWAKNVNLLTTLNFTIFSFSPFVFRNLSLYSTLWKLGFFLSLFSLMEKKKVMWILGMATYELRNKWSLKKIEVEKTLCYKKKKYDFFFLFEYINIIWGWGIRTFNHMVESTYQLLS